MPAATVQDLLVLPRIPRPDPAVATPRPIVTRITAPSLLEGEGFPVRRPFPGIAALVDPFILLDQMGAVEYAPGEAKGAPDHPHRGFETVTYMLDGVIEHRDSMGGGGKITDGATQWMTAGSGIVHSEMPPEYLVRSGGLFHGVQLWVNLPAAPQVEPAALPGHRSRPGDAHHQHRWLRPGADHRRRARRARRAGGHLHADRLCARHAAPGARLDVRGAPTSTHSSTCWRGAGASARRRPRSSRGSSPSRRRGSRLDQRRPAAGRAVTDARDPPARRTADPRADRPLRPVRDEHAGGDPAGGRRLPGGAHGTDPAGPRARVSRAERRGGRRRAERRPRRGLGDARASAAHARPSRAGPGPRRGGRVSIPGRRTGRCGPPRPG